MSRFTVNGNDKNGMENKRSYMTDIFITKENHQCTMTVYIVYHVGECVYEYECMIRWENNRRKKKEKQCPAF